MNKSVITKFIDKYHLGGNIVSVKWECDGTRKVIHTFISGCIENYEDKIEIISVSDDQLEVYHSFE